MNKQVVPRQTEFQIYDFDSGETESYYIVEIEDGEILKISETVKMILESIDGTSNISEIQIVLNQYLDCEIDSATLVEILEYLSAQGLIVLDGMKPGFASTTECEESCGDSSQRTGNERDFNLTIPFMNERVCGVIGRIFSPLFSRAVMPIVLLIVLGINLYSLFFHSMNAVWDPKYTLLFVFASIMLHEFGHIAASVHNGITPKEAGVGFFLFFPIFYVDLNRTWKLSRKSRVQIDLGGVYMQLVFSSVIIVFNSLFFPQTSSWLLAFLSFNLVLFNLMPFFRWDGYWLLSDLMGISNLNMRARMFLASKVASEESSRKYDWKYGLNFRQRIMIPSFAVFTLIYGVIIFGFAGLMFGNALTSGELLIQLEVLVGSFTSLDLVTGFVQLFSVLPYFLVPIYIVMILVAISRSLAATIRWKQQKK